MNPHYTSILSLIPLYCKISPAPQKKKVTQSTNQKIMHFHVNEVMEKQKNRKSAKINYNRR